MFQFRRFPTYTYLIQHMLIRYCRIGFPHSEISGSKLICSSPKLIAACHVLHRLLMPRHSPCALFSLTSSEQAPYPSPWPKVQGSLIPLLLLSKSKQVSISWIARNGASRMDCSCRISILVDLVLKFRIMQTHKEEFLEIVIYYP